MGAKGSKPSTPMGRVPSVPQNTPLGYILDNWKHFQGTAQKDKRKMIIYCTKICGGKKILPDVVWPVYGSEEDWVRQQLNLWVNNKKLLNSEESQYAEGPKSRNSKQDPLGERQSVLGSCGFQGRRNRTRDTSIAEKEEPLNEVKNSKKEEPQKEIGNSSLEKRRLVKSGFEARSLGIPPDSPLGKLLKNWSCYSSTYRRPREKMVYYCIEVWGGRKIGDNTYWPMYGTFENWVCELLNWYVSDKRPFCPEESFYALIWLEASENTHLFPLRERRRQMDSVKDSVMELPSTLSIRCRTRFSP
ncbi:uncharacterized protein LOC127475751 [Manacus candei]|uniref:uncharacterized protein LOC127475751 n=1 Tax=Manacus candei TaxID=415023 RepID=UPI002227C669|nr:uncharacterized protein LOC127475751 [Manacus candei]